jgi:FkbM family methyltransferase
MLTDAGLMIRYVWEHPANEGQRVRALLRAAGFQARGRLLRRPTKTRIGDHSYLWAHLHRASASMAVYANPPDHPEMLVWQRALRPGDVFVDVGANVGSYSILAADLGATVFALEPAPDTFTLLAENVRLNGYPVTTLRAAAGAACGTARFTSGQDVVNRLAAGGPEEIEVVTVDSVIGEREVAGMKVDVEGFELDVLRGCERALAGQRIKLIQLEWNEASAHAAGTDRGPMAELLAGYGYRLYRPDRDGSLVPVRDTEFGPDIFARPEPAAPRP